MPDNTKVNLSMNVNYIMTML